jgi:phosphoenolpyruvate carboxykinase (GTP)
MTAPPTSHKGLLRFVEDVAGLAIPERVVWCDASAEERDRLCQLLVDRGTFVRLNPDKRPGSYWARSDPHDVARVD